MTYEQFLKTESIPTNEGLRMKYMYSNPQIYKLANESIQLANEYINGRMSSVREDKTDKRVSITYY